MVGPILGPDFTKSADLNSRNSGFGLGGLNQKVSNDPTQAIQVSNALLNDIEQAPEKALNSLNTISKNILGTQATETQYEYNDKGQIIGKREVPIADSYNADGLIGKHQQRTAIDTALENKRLGLEQQQKELDKTKEMLVNEYRTETDLLNSLKQASSDIANQEVNKAFGDVGSFDEVYKNFENLFLQKADLDFDLAVKSFRTGGENSQIYKTLVDKGGMSKDQFYKVMSYANKVANIKAEQTNILNGELSPENTRRIYENTFASLGNKGYNNAQASYLTKMGIQLGVKSLEDSKFNLEASTFNNRIEKGMISLQALATENLLNENKRHNREIEKTLRKGQLLGDNNQQGQQPSLTIDEMKNQQLNNNLEIISVENSSEYNQGVNQAGKVFVRVKDTNTGEEKIIATDPKNINGLDYNKLLTEDSGMLNDKGQFSFKNNTTYQQFGPEGTTPYTTRGLNELSKFVKKKGLDLKTRYDNAKTPDEKESIESEARNLLGEIQSATGNMMSSDTASNYVNLNSTEQEGFVSNYLNKIGTGLKGLGKKAYNALANLGDSDAEVLINALADGELADQIKQFGTTTTNNTWAGDASDFVSGTSIGAAGVTAASGFGVLPALAVLGGGQTLAYGINQLENTQNPMSNLVDNETKQLNYEAKANGNTIINQEISKIIGDYQKETGQQMSYNQLLDNLLLKAKESNNEKYRQMYVFAKLATDNPKELYGDNAATNFIDETQKNTDKFKELAKIDDDYINKEAMNKAQAFSILIASKNPSLLSSKKAFADFSSQVYKLVLNNKLDNKALKEMEKYVNNFDRKNIKLYGFNINTPNDTLALIRNGMLDEMDGSTLQRSLQTLIGLF